MVTSHLQKKVVLVHGHKSAHSRVFTHAHNTTQLVITTHEIVPIVSFPVSNPLLLYQGLIQKWACKQHVGQNSNMAASKAVRGHAQASTLTC